MSSGPHAKPQAAVLEAGRGVRVEFCRIGDLFSHALWLGTGDNSAPVLRAAAPSELRQPCFNQLHQQDGMLLLTGAQGQCHWSMSVEVLGPGILLFDVACRIKQPMTGVGSLYQLVDGQRCEIPGSGELASIRSAVGCLQIGRHEAVGMEWPRCRVLQPYQDVLQIVSPGPPPQQFPATVRWSYAVWAI